MACFSFPSACCWPCRESDTEANTPLSSPRQHSNIVIVGGGAIGCCIAFQLAKSARDLRLNTNITVLEARPSLFLSASSHNTGCLHFGYRESYGRFLLPLGEYSFNIWKGIAEEDPTFRSTTGYRPQSFYTIIKKDCKRNGCGGDDIEKALPNWVKPDERWELDMGEHGKTCATINPQRLGDWLEKACKSLGVDIKTSTKAIDATISDQGIITAVKCKSSKAGRDSEDILPCDNLVIAAGPWTPQQVHLLFPQSAIDLAPATLAGDWLLLKNPALVEEKSTASVFFNHIVGEKLEFSGRNDGTIWVCGRTNSTAELPPLGTEALPDKDLLAELIEYSRQFVRGTKTSEKGEPSILDTGRAFRPVRQSGLPLITSVSSKSISPHAAADSSLNQRSGVFICYGHGSYGVGMGMGSGKLMAQVIYGEEPDIDISKFTLYQPGESC